MVCSECKSKFKFIDRIKSMNKRNGKIQCRNCKNIFIVKGNTGRVVNAIASGVVVFIMSFVGVSLIDRDSEHKIIGALIIGLSTGIILFSYYFISQNLWKYEKINEASEK